MFRKFVLLCTAFAPVVVLAQEADPFAGMQELSAQALVRAALERNTSVAAAEAAFEAASARPGMEGAWMDPMVEVEAAPLSAFSPEVPFGYGIELSQKIPFPGKKGLSAQAAQNEARAAKFDLGEVRLRLRETAQTLFAALYQSDRALEINALHHKLLKDMKRAAEAQYGAGMAPQQDALQAELMLAELEMERVELESRRKVTVARLNGLLHRPTNATLPPTPKQFEPDLSVPESEAVLKVALEQRPMLGAMDARVDAAASRVDLAKKAWLPDFEVMTGYSTMWMDPEHRFMVGVGIEIPLQQGMRRSQLQEAEAMAKQMRSEKLRARHEVATEVEEMREMLEEAVKVLALQKDRVIPAARAQLDAARAGYVTGRNEFQALIEAERSLRNAELRLHVARADVVRRRAALERMIGVEQ